VASWIFSNEDQLRAAMSAELIPASVQAQPARVWRTADGEIAVEPTVPLPEGAAERLSRAGARHQATSRRSREVRHWPALLAPRPLPGGLDDVGRVALFTVGHRQTLLDLLAELLRLGCDRCSFVLTDATSEGAPVALVRAYDPPFYSVARAGDRSSDYRVYAPLAPGQEQVWIEVGYTHPMADAVTPPSHHLELVDRDGHWSLVGAGTWHDALTIVDVRVPGPKLAHDAGLPDERLELPLRLAGAHRNELPSLWVVRDRAAERVERLVTSLPDDIVARLLFSVATRAADAEPIIVLRARPGRGDPPAIDLEATALVPLMGIGNLYVPHDARIEPPLRRDTLRELLAPDPDRVYWVSPSDGSRFAVESMTESAFAPLSEWIEYVIQENASELEPWVSGSVFDFEAFRSIGSEWAAAAPAAREPAAVERAPKSKRPRARNESPRSQAAVPEASLSERAARPRTAAAATAHSPDATRVALAELERRFLASESPADDPERTHSWLEMARLHAALDQARDASLCYTRALWESPADELADIAGEWATSEARHSGAVSRTLLTDSSPDRSRARALAAAWIAADAADTTGPVPAADSAPWLEAHGDMLDVRTVWLAQLALSRAVGGDRLALARTRDLLLRRLRQGLSVERDVPTFLRFVGGSGGDSAAVEQLAEQLEVFLDHYRKTSRKRSPVEAPEPQTTALVVLEFAFGFASLGRADRARELRGQAVAAVDLSDPIFGFVVRAYEARIEQAIEGRPRETPLPPAIATMLNALGKLDRYKVDRLREASTVLEPQERLDPVAAFQRGGDPRGEEFATLRGMDEVAALAREVGSLLDVATRADTFIDDRARLVDGLMDFFPMLPEADAIPFLQRVAATLPSIPAARRALLLEEALMLAGYFGRDDMIRELAGALDGILDELIPSDAVQLAAQFGSCLHSLRRVGLASRATEVIERLTGMAAGESAQALEARIHLASGLSYLGGFERAEPTLRGAQSALATLKLAPSERLRILRALAMAWSQAPRERAIAGLVELSRELPSITDSYNTNSHFCLSVVAFMDTMVLSLAQSELAMGELGRRWLDEDEYLVRRRIHRDLGDAG